MELIACTDLNLLGIGLLLTLRSQDVLLKTSSVAVATVRLVLAIAAVAVDPVRLVLAVLARAAVLAALRQSSHRGVERRLVHLTLPLRHEVLRSLDGSTESSVIIVTHLIILTP